MAEQPQQRQGLGGRAPGGRDGPRQRKDRGPKPDNKEVWEPLTKLGRLVKAGKVEKLEYIYLFALPIKEEQIIDYFLKDQITEELMRIKPVQKQTQAGQRTRFQAYVAIGDKNGHIGIGSKVAKEAQLAIRGAASNARLSLVPVRRGYWGNKIGLPHTIAMKVTGKSGSCRVRLVPAPRGSGLVAPPASKKILQLAGVGDCYTQTKGATKSTGNFVKATYNALANTFAYLTPDLWKPAPFMPTLYEEHSEFLKTSKGLVV